MLYLQRVGACMRPAAAAGNHNQGIIHARSASLRTRWPLRDLSHPRPLLRLDAAKRSMPRAHYMHPRLAKYLVLLVFPPLIYNTLPLDKGYHGLSLSEGYSPSPLDPAEKGPVRALLQLCPLRAWAYQLPRQGFHPSVHPI